MSSAIYLHTGKQNTVLRGHPWIFPKAILKQTNPVTGELTNIYTQEGELIGVGVYNEHSLYRVRVLALCSERIDTSSVANIVSHRLRQAITIRENLTLPNEMTNAYRLFNSEGDGLSGLTIDRFNRVCVVASSAFWVEAHRASILAAISQLLSEDEIIWACQNKPLAQDGWISIDDTVNTGQCLVLEAGIQYQVDFSNTQKTGLFLDQRENHQRIAALAKDKRVLDLYTYTGGFALHAARAGASSVTAIDSSLPAIELATKNAALNKIDCIEFIEADARDYLAKAADYDIVILDPPKLVPSQKHVERAKNYYRFLHREIFKSMRSGSLLMTCNCSSAINSEEFAKLVSQQALAVGKQVRILGIYGPSSCHPILIAFPEGHYLTAILLAVV